MNGPTLTAAPAAAHPRPAVVRSAAARPGVKPDADGPGLHRLAAWARLYWMMVLFCGSLLGAGLAYTAYSLLPSKYESYAILRVSSTPFTVAAGRDPNAGRTEFNTYLKTNARLIRNEFVLSKALGMEVDVDGQRVRVATLPTITAQPNPIQFLEEELQVTSSDGVETIYLTLKGHHPRDVKAIVNAVQQAFMDEVIEKEILERTANLNKVEEELVRLKARLQPLAAAKADAGMPLAGDVPPAPFERNAAKPNAPAAPAVGGAPPDAVRKAYVAQLLQRAGLLHNQAEELPLQIAAQKRAVETLDKQIKALTAAPPPKELYDEVETDSKVQTLTVKESSNRARYNMARETHANPDPARLQEYLQAAESAKAEKKMLVEQLVRAREFQRRSPEAKALIGSWDAAVRKLQELEDHHRSVTVRLQKARDEIAALPPDPEKDEPAKPGEKPKKKVIDPESTLSEANDELFHSIAYRAASLRMDIGSPKRVNVMQPASTPVQKDTKKQLLGSVFAGVMGFVLVGLGAVAYELRAKKLCGLADVKAATPVPAVGVIPWTPDSAAARDPLRRAEVHEAIDKLRSYVSQSWLTRGATTVAVTSPLGDEGKAFAAFGLASSLASGGYKTLLVDFDLRNPALHTHAGVANHAGVCELLRGEADFRRTIQALPSGLHLLTAGKWSDDARQAAVGGRLESLLSRLREPFDCVVIHAHALLTAAETVEVARRCEVVLLCAMYRDTRLPLLARAAERIATMEVPYTGVVYLGATPQEALC